ncbi:MAG: hypothetical protein ITG00_06010 [Flavobacterium sp.]|nr:hypothetical protein [Flavobacterium sp.]
MIEKSAETAAFFSMTEEELSHKEIKVEYKLTSHSSILYITQLTSGLICYENLSKHDNVFTTIFIPPPEQV